MTYLPEKCTFSKELLWLKMFENKIYVGFTNQFLDPFVKIDLVDVRDGISFKKGRSMWNCLQQKEISKDDNANFRNDSVC
ncbi:MAG TPA: hypothetical protein VLB84_14935 [Bacteroidia bacterium]|nr:hypothetical protein [Bacteroidia bacterium]